MIETHVHKETGNLYRLLFITNESCTRPGWDMTAVYIDEKGELLSRPLSVFNERCEEIK